MVSSLVLEQPVSIGVNVNGKFKVQGFENMSVNDVPAVRYRFDGTTWAGAEGISQMALECVKSHIEKFNRSIHIAEVSIENRSVTSVISELNSVFPRLAVFVYVNVMNENVDTEAFDADTVTELELLKSVRVDRIMLRDKSSNLYTVVANKLKADVARTTGIKVSNIGICESPLSVGDNCCLTAIRTRELAAKYGETADMVIPSANHEGKNCSACGCIRYIKVSESSVAPVVKGVKSSVVGEKENNLKEHNDKNEEQHNAKKKKSSKIVMPW